MSVTAACATYFAPASAADVTSRLKAEIDAARGEAGCPPFEPDPTLNSVSERAARESAAWVNHTARSLPLEDGTVTAALREAGYIPLKARLLNGYGDYRTGGIGDNDDKAIRATVLAGLALEVLPDCTYTKYGLSSLSDDGSQGWPSTVPRSFTVTAVIVAGE